MLNIQSSLRVTVSLLNGRSAEMKVEESIVVDDREQGEAAASPLISPQRSAASIRACSPLLRHAGGWWWGMGGSYGHESALAGLNAAVRRPGPAMRFPPLRHRHRQDYTAFKWAAATGNGTRGTPVAAATWAMICCAINLAREISADLSSPTNEAVKLLLCLHVSLWMNRADRSRTLLTPGPERWKDIRHRASDWPIKSRDQCRRSRKHLSFWRRIEVKLKWKQEGV